MMNKYLFAVLFLSISTLLMGQKNTGGVESPESYATSLEKELDFRSQWDTLMTFPLYGKNYNVSSIETDGINYFSTTWDTNWFFRHHIDGRIFRAFQIEEVEHIRDMAYADYTGYFYGSNASMTLYELDLNNEKLVRKIPVSCDGVYGIRHISYDPTLDNSKGGFWIGNYSQLGAIDMEGKQLVAASEIHGTLSECYGSAYDKHTDPDNPKLWMFFTKFYNGNAYKPTKPFFKSFDIKTKTLSNEAYQVDGTGWPGWRRDSVRAGGAGSVIINDSYYLVAAFQVYNPWNTNIAAVLELAKVGVEENDMVSKEPAIYPNPVTSAASLHLNGFEAEELVVYNAMGIEVRRVNMENIGADASVTLDMSAWASGIYYAYLRASAGQKLIKIMKK